MRFRSLSAPCVVLALLAPVAARAQSSLPPAAVHDATLGAFLRELERATADFVNGDPAAWQRLVSPREDATVMGAWGAFERGRPEVRARYDWAAARFRPSGAAVRVEYLSAVSSGDLACTVAIERSVARVAAREAAAPMALRVTHVMRKEDGAWRLVHRHADPLVERTAPGAVLRPADR